MRSKALSITVGTFVIAGVLALVAAVYSLRLVERGTRAGVERELDLADLDWAEVDVNGLQLYMIGTAPDEAARFKALSVAGRVVDAARVIDQMNVEEPDGVVPPRFSIEILRNDAGLSVIGLVPSEEDRAALVEAIQDVAGAGAETADLLEVASFEAPEGWSEALRFAAEALVDLPRSKISVEAGQISVIAMAESEDEKRRLEARLARRAPDELRLAVQISAPRPVITPFTLRFLIDADGPRFDACSAGSEDSRDRILAAARAAGLEGKAECRIGLGVPSRRWAEAAELAIGAVAQLGAGSVTFSDADLSLVAAEGTAQSAFDKVAGDLEAALPEVFALRAVLPEPIPDAPQGPPEFVATLSPEGAVQLRGRLGSQQARQTADSFAQARFGSGVVHTAARVAEGLPADWSVRTLTGIEALAMLSNGAVIVTPGRLSVTGKTGNVEASAEIAGLLADKLGEGAQFDIDVTYVEQLDPLLGLPTPEECEAQIVEIIGDRKITFEPGSARLDESAKDILDEVADLLKICGEIPLEIGGHTDSQGREVMNRQLSQDRAQAVLQALRDRRVLTAGYAVRGYGEEQPIADNDTEEGRESNRRIEFRLIRPDPIEEVQTTLESVAEETAGSDDDAAASEDSADEQN